MFSSPEFFSTQTYFFLQQHHTASPTSPSANSDSSTHSQAKLPPLSTSGLLVAGVYPAAVASPETEPADPVTELVTGPVPDTPSSTMSARLQETASQVTKFLFFFPNSSTLPLLVLPSQSTIG
jgi:hypothetical protein